MTHLHVTYSSLLKVGKHLSLFMAGVIGVSLFTTGVDGVSLFTARVDGVGHN